MNQELDFALLDDILPISTPSTATATATIRAAHVQAIGPLVEFGFQSRRNHLGLPSGTDPMDGTEIRALRSTLARGGFNRMSTINSLQARSTEFHWVPTSSHDFSRPAWITFQRRLQNAAEQAGFAQRIAAGLAGAFGEMADNAYLHSLKPATAIAGYRWTQGCFEYIVADAGQGILSSLRMCRDYAHVEDAGDALQVALTAGESCLGRNAGRGTGFSQVFLSLCNLNGQLRFRSGDHALTLDGTAPKLSSARLSQLGLDFAGFLVSVVCRPF